MPLEDKGPAPYAPGKGVLAFIDQIRDKGLPSTIDQDYLAPIPDVGDSYARRTLRALEQLDLIELETGQPTPILEKIALEGSDKLKGTLAEWFNNAYEPILRYASPNQDIEVITDQFRRYTPGGQKDRMVQLFFALAEAAGLVEEVPRRPRGIHATSQKSGRSDRKVSKSSAKSDPLPPRSRQKPMTDTASTGDTAKERYLNLLIGLAEATDGTPDPHLLDRIERVLGVPKQEVSS